MMMWRERDCVQKLRYVQIGDRPLAAIAVKIDQYMVMLNANKKKSQSSWALMSSAIHGLGQSYSFFRNPFDLTEPELLYEASGHPYSNVNALELFVGN